MAWQCAICGIDVPQISGPIGMRCRAHKHWKQHTCPNCDTPFVAHKTRKYCSAECIPKRERQAPRTDLQWRQCGHCQRWMSRPGRKYCGAQCAREFAAAAAGWRNRKCKRCSAELGYISLDLYCRPCIKLNKSDRKRAERAAPDYRRAANNRQRARHYGVEYEPVKASTVFARDRWRCGICRKRVDKRLKYPHPMSASLDHIVPMSLGGGHTYLNTQCAHWICNCTKSHTGGGDQLALIG